MSATTLSAGVLFSDNFEGASLNPGNWASNVNGAPVVDPLNASNQVLHFTNNGSGGDLFSTPIATVATYYLSFDYYFSTAAFSFGGGFVGVNAPGETWLLGDCGGCYGTYSSLLNNIPGDVWNHVELSFPLADIGTGPVSLKLEQFQGPAGNAYFDNIVVSDDAFAATSTPEPASGILFVVGAGLTFFARRLKRARR